VKAWKTLNSKASITKKEHAVSAALQAEAAAIGQSLTPEQLAAHAGTVEERLKYREARNRLAQTGVTGQQYQLAAIQDATDARSAQFMDVLGQWDVVRGAVRGAFTLWSLARGFGALPGGVAAAMGGVAGSFIGSEKMLQLRQQFATLFIGKPDQYFKLLDFHANYAAELAAGTPEARAFQTAAMKTLDAMPNYEATWAWLRSLSQIGLGGSFVAFQFELYRNTFHNIRLTAVELKSGKAAIVARGLKRLAGVSAVVATSTTLIQGMAMAAMKAMGLGEGEDDERKKRAFQRSLAAPWDKYSPLAFARLDSDQVTWMNTGYLVPQTSLGNVVRAAMAGKSWDETAVNVMKEMKNQFAGGNVATGPLIEAISGKKNSTGADVSNEAGWREVVARADYFLSGVYAPGTADKLERVARATQGRHRDDRTFSLEEEVARIWGLRVMSRPVGQLAENAYQAIGGDARKADAMAKKTEKMNDLYKEQVIDRARMMAGEVLGRIATLEADLETLGFSSAEIKSLRKSAGYGASWNEISEDTEARLAVEKKARSLR
jgi:hypothetical protein